MNLEYVGRVLSRLRPFVQDRVIRRSRIERVLATLQSQPDGLREELERLLAKAGVAVDEDLAPVADAPELLGEMEDEPPRDAPFLEDSPTADRGNNIDAVAAARERMYRDRYIHDLSRVLLKAEEEVGLAILLHGTSDKPLAQGDFARLAGEARAAAECLLLHNQRLVHSVAQRYAPPGMDYEDMIQHGLIGLMRAVELFDPSLGNKFSTYAMHWIHQSITRAIANESRMIRLPVHMYERVQKVWQTRARLTSDGVEPPVHQLALACDLTVNQVNECLRLGPQDILSLDTPVGPDGETTLGEILDRADPTANPELEVEFALLQEQLHAVLDTFSEREASIVSMRFGLADGEPKTLDEIGKVYGVTRERIRQIEKSVMSRLRHPSRSMVLRPFLYVIEELPQAKSNAGEE